VHNTLEIFVIMKLAALLLLLCSAENSLAFSTPLKGIDASQFRHPLDRQLTNAIQNAPFNKLAEGAIRSSFSLVEQGVRLDLLSSAVKVSNDQLPELHEAMQSAAAVLDMSVVPELYIQSSPQANAYTLALQNKNNSPPIVVVTSTLLERCTNEEIQAIIGHELGHLKCSHSLYLTLGGLVSQPLRGLPIVGGQTEQLLQQWRLAAEYSCDRAALLVAQDVNVVAGAMLKLFAGTRRVTNTKAFMEQAREYDRLLKDANPLVRMSVGMQPKTHPLPVKRVVELEKWAESEEYKSLIRGTVN
jgi:Zn-dependent protease with chaperone function